MYYSPTPRREDGLFTTPGCFQANLYQAALQKAGCIVVLQTSDELQQTMHYVDQIKAGDTSLQVVQGLQEIATALTSRGATVLIAACTELPLVLKESMFDVPFISSTQELAKRTVAYALGSDEQESEKRESSPRCVTFRGETNV